MCPGGHRAYFDGRSVCVFGSAGIDLPDEEERMVGWRRRDLRVLRANGASFRVKLGWRERIVDITSPVGAFVVVDGGRLCDGAGLDIVGGNVGVPVKSELQRRR